jgi:serine acetyltransferase
VRIGTGAVVIDGSPEERLTIGDDVTIGAGACVTQSIPSGLTVVGVPAKPIDRKSVKP